MSESEMSQTQVLPIEEKTREHNVLNPVGFIILEDTKLEVKIGHNNIGRDPQRCSIIINDRTVSKVHSVIEYESVDNIFIYDNGSTNKTMLGRNYLKPHCRYKLEHNNLITMGNISVRFILLSNTQNHQQWHSLKNLDKIFDAETQLSFSEMQDHFPNTSSTVKIMQTNKSYNLNPEDGTKCDKQTTISTTLNRNVGQVIDLEHLQNHVNLESTAIQNCHLEKLENSDIFNLETQCDINPKSVAPFGSTHNGNPQLAAANKESLHSILPVQNDCTTMNSCDSGLPNSVPKNSSKNALVFSSGLKDPVNIIKIDNSTKQVKEKVLLPSVYETNLLKDVQDNYFVENNNDDDDDDETILDHFINEDDEKTHTLNLISARNIAVQHTMVNQKTSESKNIEQNYSSIGKNQENQSCPTTNHSSHDTSPNSSKTKPSFFQDQCSYKSLTKNAKLPNATVNSFQPGRPLDYNSNNEKPPSSPLFDLMDPSDSEDFIETNLISSPRKKLELDNNVFRPISLVTNIASVVAESSDDDKTVSDLEIIDDTPYFQRIRSMHSSSGEQMSSNTVCQKRLIFSSPVRTTEVFSISPTRQNSEDSESSDSSYVFDVINETENMNKPLFREHKNFKTVPDCIHSDSFVSDSDGSDIIEMTPLPNRSPSFSGKSVSTREGSNNSEITGRNQNPTSKSESANESHLYELDSIRKNPFSQELKEIIEKLKLKGSELVKMEEMKMQKNNSHNPDDAKHVRNEINNIKIAMEKTCGKRERISCKGTELEPMKKLKRLNNNYPGRETIDDIIGEERFAPKQTLQMVQSVNNTQAQYAINSDFDNLENVGDSTSKEIASSGSIYSDLEEIFRKKSKVKKFQSDYKKKFASHHSKPSEKDIEEADNKKTVGSSEEGFCKRFPLSVKQIPENSPGKSAKKTEDASENSAMRIAFTGFDSVILDKIIEELGGEKTEDLHCANVLVTDQIRRTVKFLCAIGLAIPVTSPQWLLSSQKNKRFLNPWNYILKCEESEKKWNFNLKSALEKSTERKLLEGFSVFATSSVKPPVEDILSIIKCCGGTPLRDKPKTWTKHTIVVSCLEDKKAWPPWKFKFVEVLHYEFILSGVLQQNLDFNTFKLR